MEKELNALKLEAISELTNVKSLAELKLVKEKYLGKSSKLKAIISSIKNTDEENRAKVGIVINDFMACLNKCINDKNAALSSSNNKMNISAEEYFDITLPGQRRGIGHVHPLTQVLNRIKEVFLEMGFEVIDSFDVENVYYEFDAVNVPSNHPIREMSDTFYISKDLVLRGHLTPMEIRVMEKGKLPIRSIIPGRVYRYLDEDAAHSSIFHQVEGIVVGKNISLGHLKGTLEAFAKALFNEGTSIRFRPHHYPFTEPSVEVDFLCFACGGKGCKLCKREGWIQMVGAGMIHPALLKNGGIDPEEYQGFSFALSVERIAMLLFGIDDIRYFYENDLPFLVQF